MCETGRLQSLGPLGGWQELVKVDPGLTTPQPSVVCVSKVNKDSQGVCQTKQRSECWVCPVPFWW